MLHFVCTLLFVATCSSWFMQSRVKYLGESCQSTPFRASARFFVKAPFRGVVPYGCVIFNVYGMGMLAGPLNSYTRM